MKHALDKIGEFSAQTQDERRTAFRDIVRPCFLSTCNKAGSAMAQAAELLATGKPGWWLRPLCFTRATVWLRL